MAAAKLAKADKLSKYAYVLFVMRGDKYVPGAMICAYSLRISGTSADIICMVTHDVSPEARAALGTVCDYVVEVQYMEYKIKHIQRERERKLYGEWASQIFTHWQCLQFESYKKICSLDVDLIVYRNLDHLFELRTPAGIFASPKLPEKLRHQGALIPFKYTDLRVPSYATTWGGCNILTPSLKMLDALKKMIEIKQPYGYSPMIQGVDEQSLTQFYHINNQRWTQIGQNYFNLGYVRIENAIIGGKLEMFIQHFMAADKPWWATRDLWPDFEIWWQIAEMFKSDPRVPELGRQMFCERIDAKIMTEGKKICGFCAMAAGRIAELTAAGKWGNEIPTPNPKSHVFVENDRIVCKLATGKK